MKGYPSYHAPRTDGSWLCDPNGESLDGLAQANRALLTSSSASWLGLPLREIRRSLQSELAGEALVFLSGHQPELFHPGVWFKNFLLSKMAKKASGVAVNILVDHDLARSVVLEVPTISDDRLQRISVEVASGASDIPWEYAYLEGTERFHEAALKVSSELQELGIVNTLLQRMMPTIEEGFRRKEQPLGTLLAAARHKLETEFGLETREIAFSRMTDSLAWATFVGEILTRLHEFHLAYNAALANYRTHHQIKNLAQPILDLRRDGDWFEAPFWIYESNKPSRRPLWIRSNHDRIELSDRQDGPIHRFAPEKSPEAWRALLDRLAKLGSCIRPRALTTTMYLRLAVADAFIHGIGGAKYDQVTDHIIGSFWNMEPPRYIVATATLHLPFTSSPSKSCTLDEMSARTRDWRFTPERAVDGLRTFPEADGIIAEKQRLLSRPITKEMGRRVIKKYNC